LATTINESNFLTANLTPDTKGSLIKLSYWPVFKNGIGFDKPAHFNFWPLPILKENTFNKIIDIINSGLDEVVKKDLQINTNLNVFPGLEYNSRWRKFLKYNNEIVGGGALKEGINLYLKSNTSLSSQKSEILNVLFHELTHDLLNHGKTEIPDDISERQSKEYHHHIEYLANAGSAFFAGKEFSIHFAKFFIEEYNDDRDSKTHPSNSKIIYSLENEIYKEDLLKNLEAAKSSSYNPWLDYVKNREMYKYMHDMIDAGVKSR